VGKREFVHQEHCQDIHHPNRLQHSCITQKFLMKASDMHVGGLSAALKGHLEIVRRSFVPQLALISDILGIDNTSTVSSPTYILETKAPLNSQILDTTAQHC